MPRISTALKATAQPPAEIAQPVVVRSAKVLSLLLVLEALRLNGVDLDRQKV
jgi:hypothetical protein